MRKLFTTHKSDDGITVTHHGAYGTDSHIELDVNTLEGLGFMPKRAPEDTPWPGYVMTIEAARCVLAEIRDSPHKPAQRAMGRMSVRLKIPLIDVVLKHGDPRKWERVGIRHGHAMSQDDAMAILSKFGLNGDDGKSLLDAVKHRAHGRSPAMVLMQEGDPRKWESAQRKCVMSTARALGLLDSFKRFNKYAPILQEVKYRAEGRSLSRVLMEEGNPLNWPMFAHLRIELNRVQADTVLSELKRNKPFYGDVISKLRSHAGDNSLRSTLMKLGDPRKWHRFEHYLSMEETQRVFHAIDRKSFAWSRLCTVAKDRDLSQAVVVMHCGDPREWAEVKEHEQAERAKHEHAMDLGLAKIIWLTLDNKMSRLILDACEGKNETAVELIQRLGDPNEWKARVTGIEGDVVSADVFVPKLGRAAAVCIWEGLRPMTASAAAIRLKLYERMSKENLDLIECIQRYGDPREWK